MATSDVEYRCFVGGLAWAIDDYSLEEAFRPFGDVVDSKIINDREIGRSRGFEFVTFSNEQAMRDAIKGMNGKSLYGRSITVNEARLVGAGMAAAEEVFVVKAAKEAGYGRGGGGYGGGRHEGDGGYSRGGDGGWDRNYGSGNGGGYEGTSRYSRGSSEEGSWRN